MMVVSATTLAPQCASPSRLPTAARTAPAECACTPSSPSASLSACTAISSAAPLVKPNSAEGEMKLASEPSRSRPTASCITPTRMVTASAIWI
ncbi:Uncharacterised protein [Bordetella pertussis]|nr:Uncharacterised protein [Bordetella pertussis]CFM17912.1 Uncharacterised protein [Bordetella pertussis]CFN48421.1 Uncharacterised protein [Bordetella pertussis]CFO36260.1 Uncharacterised protein [Bordetella pertussis]CFO97425.1 Uncharacterised protein [Bordetella pertussis]